MRKAEEIFKEVDTTKYPDCYKYSEVIKAIKIAQEEAIRETVKECAENAEIEEYDEHFQYSPHVCESLILSVADKLIKEL